MGRPATPNAILKKRGSKKIRKDEPEPAEGDVIPTRELTKEGKAAWVRLCAVLDELGVMSPSYAEIITLTADSLGNIEIAANDLKERGHISITERGETKNPSFTIKATEQAAAYRGLISLGLSPTAISKLTGTKKPEVDEWDL